MYRIATCTALLWSDGICALPTNTPMQLMSEMNSVWDSAAGESKISPTVDISIAVATPNGLITPIVSNADRRTIPEIAAVFKVRREVQSSLMCPRLKCSAERPCRAVLYMKCCGVHGVQH